MPSSAANHRYFVLILTYVKPIEEVDRFIEAHVSYLIRHYEQGHFLTSGARVPRNGGVIFARAESKEQVERIIAEDPFLSEGVARYEIVEFHPSRFAPGFDQLFA